MNLNEIASMEMPMDGNQNKMETSWKHNDYGDNVEQIEPNLLA